MHVCFVPVTYRVYRVLAACMGMVLLMCVVGGCVCVHRVEVLSLPSTEPRVVFIREVLARCVRLSYPERVEKTLPEPFLDFMPGMCCDVRVQSNARLCFPLRACLTVS